MKASMKFREEQKPLIRAKIPLNILGFPFQSGIIAGESKELSLNLTTFFESGPSVKLAYRPNDSTNPFSLVFKTGIGHLGSPVSSSLNMSAEFNLVGGGSYQNHPRFFVTFKPQFGDFKVKKTQSSVFQKHGTRSGHVSDDVGIFNRVMSDVDLSATTVVPLRGNARLNFRWGMRVPATEDAATLMMKKIGGSTAEIMFQKLPFLVMNKIGIEHVASGDCGSDGKVGAGCGDVAEAFLGFKKQMEGLQGENGVLRKNVESLRSEFAAVKCGKGNKGNCKKEVIGHFGGNGLEDEDVDDE